MNLFFYICCILRSNPARVPEVCTDSTDDRLCRRHLELKEIHSPLVEPCCCIHVPRLGSDPAVVLVGFSWERADECT